MAGNDDHYHDQTIAFLGEIWGDGYMSPGGSDEVSRVIEGLPIAGSTVLDIGCGSGAIAVELSQHHKAAKVVGIDVEAPVCEAALSRVQNLGLQDAIQIREVTPGPLPFEDASFDVVFSKDSIIHIADKEFLAAEAFRVLKPGGWFAASDWLISHDNEPSPAMAAYIAAEDLDFAMASPQRYEKAMKLAGFEDVKLRNRNAWYREVSAAELADLKGNRPRWVERYGDAFIDEQIDIWTRLVDVVASGEHCPHHIRGRKPQ